LKHDASQRPGSLFLGMAGCLAAAAVLGPHVAKPFVARFLAPPPPVPVTKAAVEGDVSISDTWDPRSTGAYQLKTSDGRTLDLYCGPWPNDELCLHRVGLERGRAYRLTVGYYVEQRATGEARNVITRVRFGDADLITPSGQAKAWRNLLVKYLPKKDRYGTTAMDGFFWSIHALLTAAFLAACAGALVFTGRIVLWSRARRTTGDAAKR
jgi:hypothetical protein